MSAPVEQDGVDQQLARRRRAVAAAWGSDDAVVLIGAGDAIGVPGRGDITYPFRAHSEYYYLTDRNRPGGVLTFDPQDGWCDFVAPITEAERLWAGAAGELDGEPVSALTDWLAARNARPTVCLGAPIAGVQFDADQTAEWREMLNEVRRVKDAVELERMRAAERATSAAFAAAAALLQEGYSERAVQIELEAAAFRHGGDAMAYDTVVAGGPNSAVLHFAPTSRALRAGELVLIDAGAEVSGYASDITRTYPVGEGLTTMQAEVHALVHAAQLAAIERCAPGTQWRDVHLTAAAVIAQGLVDLELIRGQPDSVIESGALWMFFPHGIGHLVGLGVRDTGGAAFGQREDPPPSPSIPHLRFDLPLRAGFVVTVEPGIYFVPALLQDPDRRHRYRDQVMWDRVDGLLEFGGIRIEDNLLITAHGHEILTRDVSLLSS